MQKTVRFLIGFLKHPLRNSVCLPSSPVLCRNMVRGLDFSRIHTIVELGAGTGVITEEIVRHARPGTRIITIEIDKKYNTFLEKHFGDKIIVETASCDTFDAVLRKHGIDKPDCIISGLPLPSIPQHVSRGTIALIKKYTKEGTIFRMFTYVPWKTMKMIDDPRLEKKSFTVRNFPPAYVLGIN